MADNPKISQIKLPNGSTYDIKDEVSEYITLNDLPIDQEIPVSRIGDVEIGDTVGTESTNLPTSKAVVDYVEERLEDEIGAIDVGVTGIQANGTSLSVVDGVVNIPAIGPNQTVGLITKNILDNIYNEIPTSTSQLTNDSGFITSYKDEKVKQESISSNNSSYKPILLAYKSDGITSTNYVNQNIVFCYQSSTQTLSGVKKLDGDGFTITLPNATGTVALTSDIPTIPTNISAFTNDAGYLTSSDIASVLTYKGTKTSVANLPSTGNKTGDVWHITADGSEYAWDGSIWQELGTAIDLSGYAAKATTLAGYGISDAKIENGTITLGSNSITPLTSYTETDPVFLASAAYGISSSDISNWNAKSDTDEKVKAVSVTNDGSIRYIIFGSNSGNAETKYYHSGLGYSVTSSNVSTFILGNNTNKGQIRLLRGGGNTFYINIEGTPSGNRTLTLPDKTGTVALTSDIPTVPTNISAFTNDSGYLTSYTETDPVFSASAAAGITSTDISNWNAKVSDTKTWGDVVLGNGRADTSDSRYVVQFTNTSNTSATTSFVVCKPEPFALGIPKWDGNNYLYAATPAANDNSTKVATTAYVDAAIPVIPTYKIGYSDNSVGSAIVGTAITEEPNYTPSGDITLETEDIKVVTDAGLYYTYGAQTLYINGVSLQKGTVASIKSATFNGNSVTFKIKTVEE